MDDEFWFLNSKTDFEIKCLQQSEKQIQKGKGEILLSAGSIFYQFCSLYKAILHIFAFCRKQFLDRLVGNQLLCKIFLLNFQPY